MGLIADSRDLALHDLLQVKEMSRATCRVFVNGREADGIIHLLLGEVVFAAYGDLEGEAAAHAILEQSKLVYRVTSDALPLERNMRARPAALVMEAVRMVDERLRPTRPSAMGLAPASETPVPVRPTTPKAPATRPPAKPSASASGAPAARPRRLLLVAAVLVLASAAAVGAALALRRPASPTRAALAPEAVPVAGADSARETALSSGEPEPALEASALHQPADALPRLVTSAELRVPDVELGLKPSIVCRLLIDRNGAVARAEIYQRRAELVAFEAAALDAAKQFRFEPARRAGQPVAVWINWPVRFK